MNNKNVFWVVLTATPKPMLGLTLGIFPCEPGPRTDEEGNGKGACGERGEPA